MALSLSAFLPSPALRRTVAAVCAAAFLLVSLLHCVHHLNGMQVSAGYDVSVTSTGDLPTPPEGATFVDHCPVCTGMVAVETASILVADRVAMPGPVLLAEAIRPHPPAAENPPPIALI